MKPCRLSAFVLAGIFFIGATARPESPFCGDPAATRGFFKQLCDFIVAEKPDNRVMFRGAYYMRTLVAGYEIFGERKYLETAVAFADRLLANQNPSGYWPTGYKAIFFADTGSAIGLFIALDRHVDAGRRRKYLEAVRRHVTAVERDGFINPSGGIGAGWLHYENGTASRRVAKEYTVGSALCGGEVFTWMYTKTGEEKYRGIARNALNWILSTMAGDGRIPYIFEGEGTDPLKKGDWRNDYLLWERIPYDSSAYIGEGVAAFDLHCSRAEWQAEIRKKIEPHIEWLIRTQNCNGTWAIMDSHDQKRSPLIVNFLSWYHRHVKSNERIVRAIRKYDQFLLVPANAKFYGLLNWGARPGVPIAGEDEANDVLTAMVGLAVAEIIQPGITCDW
jgi:hypothetical protein